jgi:ribosomal protein S18 acetylase RimI-like enzyme
MKKLTLHKGIDFLAYREGQNGTTEIYDIAVMSERRKGHGSKLLRMLASNKGGHLYAFLRASNHKAKDFYKANGFNGILIPKFYPDEDAYIMIKVV